MKFFALVVLAILGFACYGFICLCRLIAKRTDSPTQYNKPPKTLNEFLFVAVIAMVSHAQQSLAHVWPWWAFGILTGTGILITFGLFEKRRNDLVRIGKQMREWDG